MMRHHENEDQVYRLSALQMFLAFLSNVRVGRPVGRTRSPRDKEATFTHNENLENPRPAGLAGDDHRDVSTGRWAGFKRKVRKLFRRTSHSHRDSDEELQKSSMANDAAGVSTIPDDIIRESSQERDKASVRCTVSTPALKSRKQNHTLEAHGDRDWCQLRDWPRELNHVIASHFVSTPTTLISRPRNPPLEVQGDQDWCQLKDLPKELNHVTESHFVSSPTPPTPLISRPRNPPLEVHGDQDCCQLKDLRRELNFVSSPTPPTPLISRPRNPSLRIRGDQDLCQLRDLVRNYEPTIPESHTKSPCQLDRVGKLVFVSEASEDNRGLRTDENGHEPEGYVSEEDLHIGRPPTTDPQATRHPPTICYLTPGLRRRIKECLDDVRTPGLEYSYSWEEKLISGDEIEYVRECDVPAFLPAGISTPNETGRREYFKDDVKFLGNGSFGSAYLAKMNGQSVVIKLFLCGWSPLEAIVKEARMMSHVEGKRCSPKCLGLVQLEVSETFMNCGLVMEYIGDKMVEDSNMFEVYRNDRVAFAEHKDMVIPRSEWFGIAYRLTLAVKKIHEMQVIVNDIKINNVLLRREGKQWTPYIIDFGISVMKSAATFRMPGERHNYVAPELYTGDSNASQKSDVFALGYVLHLLSRAFNLHLNDVVGRCASVDPKCRPTADVLSKILRERMRRVSSLNCGLRPQC